MKTNFIMAQDRTFKSGDNGFMVNIQGEALESDRKMYFHDALKAMRYCFILKRQTGFEISAEAITLLSNAHKATKQQPEPATELPITPASEAEQVEPEVTPAKPKRGRPKGSKNKKNAEKAE